MVVQDLYYFIITLDAHFLILVLLWVIMRIDLGAMHILLGHPTFLVLGLRRVDYFHMDQCYWHTYQNHSTMEEVVVKT